MAEKEKAAPESRIIFMGDHLRGFEPGQRVSVDPETADFLVEHGHATLPKSKQ